MPRCLSISHFQGRMTNIFNIDASVGKNGINKREDVLLIQYLLAVWLATEKDVPKLLPLLATTPAVKIDGICGDKTKAVINTFETFHQPSVVRDGRFDPLFQTVSSNKLFLLNQLFFFAGGLRGNIFVVRDIPFPKEIQKLLYH